MVATIPAGGADAPAASSLACWPWSGRSTNLPVMAANEKGIERTAS